MGDYLLIVGMVYAVIHRYQVIKCVIRVTLLIK